MNIQIETDESIVLSSGSILVDYRKPLYFKMYNNTMNFKIIFEAIKESESLGTEYKLLEEEDNTFQVKIKFPKSHQFTTATREPLHLAFKDGKKIFFMFNFQYNDPSVDKIETEVVAMVFNYTWLINK